VFAGGKVTDPVTVGQTLKQLAARAEVTETRALVAVSDATATFRIVYLPRTATDHEVGAAVSKELPLDPERIATRWVDVASNGERRVVYAVAWDRAMVKSITDAIKAAGFDAVVVELKSAALARTTPEAACVVLDLASNPVEIVLVDRYLPQLWHSFRLDGASGEVAPQLAGPLRSVLRFYNRERRGDFGPTSPVLVSSEQSLAAEALAQLAELIAQPVQVLTPSPRVATNVRHSTYLTCIGLIMRRN
jgi:hypothetical protein